VLKNLVTLGTGEVVARAMHAVGFILIARALGHQALGQFGLAVAVTSYVLLFVTQGFDQIAFCSFSACPMSPTHSRRAGASSPSSGHGRLPSAASSPKRGSSAPRS